ncbi:hypothetical protein V1289_007013 [Bradyrhizobium sp. AZCC 2289]
MFPFTVVPACNLPVYASQRPLPDATQDSVRGCSLKLRGRLDRLRFVTQDPLRKWSVLRARAVNLRIVPWPLWMPDDYLRSIEPLIAIVLALQLPFMQFSESMGNHDSKIVDAASVD